MYLLLILALLSALWLSFNEGSSTMRAQDQAMSTSIEVEQYRVFMHAASTYMANWTTTVSIPTPVYWSQIKTAVGIAPGVVSLAMPASWKIMQLPTGDWVACTEMEAASISELPSRVVNGSLIDSGTNSKGSSSINQTAAGLPLTAVTGTTGTLTLSSLGTSQPTHFVMADTSTAVTTAATCI